MIDDHKPLRMVFLRLRSLGDTVLMTPLLAVAKRRPHCVVAAAVEAPYHEILLNNPNLDRLIVVERRQNKLLARWRALREIRAFAPHLAIDLHGGTTSSWMARFSSAPQRVGYASSRNSYLYNLKVPDSRRVWQKQELHTVEHQLAFLKHLGFPVEPLPDPEIRLTAGEVTQARRRLRELGVDESFILVHPAAAFATKQWPAENFAELCRELTRDALKVIVTAGPGEESVLERVRSHGPGDALFLPPLPLRLFAAVTSLCRLYVGNDTGATHVAAALGRRIVVVFGSSDYRVWYPWRSEHQLIRHDLPCVPCPGYRCLYYEKPLCIRSVSPKAVIEAARSLYDANQQVAID
ncbi:MAG: glycosyltransferase family 9 protein [Acidobacteriota bacterium]